MKQGDIIIVDGKAMTLKPGASEPYDKSDYVEIERSRSVPASIRNMLYAKLRVRPIVAQDELARRTRSRTSSTPKPRRPHRGRDNPRRHPHRDALAVRQAAAGRTGPRGNAAGRAAETGRRRANSARQ